MEQIKIPVGYHADLNLHDTQIAIKTVKDFFQQTLAQKYQALAVLGLAQAKGVSPDYLNKVWKEATDKMLVKIIEIDNHK